MIFADFVSEFFEVRRHIAHTPKWCFRILLIQHVHQHLILGAYPDGLVIQRRAGDSQQDTLPAQAKNVLFFVNERSTDFYPKRFGSLKI